MRALRFFTANVPKPTIWTSLSFLRPRWIDWISALTARSACAFEHSVPSCFWTSSTRSALFMGCSVEFATAGGPTALGRAPQESTRSKATMARQHCRESPVWRGLRGARLSHVDSTQAVDRVVPMFRPQGGSAFLHPRTRNTHEDRGLRSHSAASVHWLLDD